MPKLWPVLIAACAVLATAAAAPLAARRGPLGLEMFPDAPAACGGKASALFQKCRPQAEVLNAAVARARAQDKAVLIEVGADWCASCIVMDRYLNGQYGPAEPPGAGTPADAAALGRFAASSFVMARLNTDDPTIDAALRPLGLKNDKSQGIPNFYVLYAGKVRRVRTEFVEIRTAGNHGGFGRRAVMSRLHGGLQAVRPGTP
jgi:hypothetical protein